MDGEAAGYTISFIHRESERTDRPANASQRAVAHSFTRARQEREQVGLDADTSHGRADRAALWHVRDLVAGDSLPGVATMELPITAALAELSR